MKRQRLSTLASCGQRDFLRHAGDDVNETTSPNAGRRIVTDRLAPATLQSLGNTMVGDEGHNLVTVVVKQIVEGALTREDRLEQDLHAVNNIHTRRAEILNDRGG